MSPELVAYESVLEADNHVTDLNPALSDRRYGAWESMRWPAPVRQGALAFLVKPLGYRPAPVPLVVRSITACWGRQERTFLLDGAGLDERPRHPDAGRARLRRALPARTGVASAG